MSNLVSRVWDDQEKITLLKDTYARDLSPKQFEVFCHIAGHSNLDPFKKEIYPMIVSKKLVVIVGIDGFRKTAHESGDYMGMDPIAVEYDEDGKIISAECVVYKHVHGHKCPFSAKVLFKEYDKRSGNWKSMPLTMIQKVAEAHALRKAFPNLGQMYMAEEVTSRDVSEEYDVTAVNEMLEKMDKPKKPKYKESKDDK